MRVRDTSLQGVKLVEPPTNFEDFRGSYVELYNEEIYRAAGIDQDFVQDDISVSRRHVLRGIHGDQGTWKLVSCLHGRFHLVVVNWDPASPQFRQWEGFLLSDRNRLQVLIPPRFGNGHVVLSREAIFPLQADHLLRPGEPVHAPLERSRAGHLVARGRTDPVAAGLRLATVNAPLVTIVTICKNGGRFVRKCIESVLAQTLVDVEYVFQDGASTDGTLEIVREYQERFPGRIQLVSEPDGSPEEGFYRGLRRARGGIIGTCLVDEELLPHAAQWAAEAFADQPQCGAIYGDYQLIGPDGQVLERCPGGSFSLQRYLCHEMCPPFLSSFFRRECLRPIIEDPAVGTTRLGEIELWLRLAMAHPVNYLPEPVARFIDHPGRNTLNKAIYADLIPARIVLLEPFFADAGTPPEIAAMRSLVLGGMQLWAASMLMAGRAWPEAVAAIEAALAHDPDPARLLTAAEALGRVPPEEWPRGAGGSPGPGRRPPRGATPGVPLHSPEARGEPFRGDKDPVDPRTG